MIWLKQYKTPQLDAYFQTISNLGEGDYYFYFMILVWAQGRWNKHTTSIYEGNYFALTFVIAQSICNLLKGVLMKGRPFFDNITLVDLEMQDCSAEFGNPSGHSLNTVAVVLTMHWYYLDLYKPKQWVELLSYQVCSIFVMSVVYSRVYTGFHSFDQCLNGVILGYLVAHFSYYYWRPYVFNIDLQKQSHHGIQLALYFALFAAFTLFTVGLFFYIENYF